MQFDESAAIVVLCGGRKMKTLEELGYEKVEENDVYVTYCKDDKRFIEISSSHNCVVAYAEKESQYDPVPLMLKLEELKAITAILEGNK